MKRKIINALAKWKSSTNRKPLIIKGARQVGKTWILEEFGKTHFQQYHYLNFENSSQLRSIFEKDLNPQRIINELTFFLNAPIRIDTDLIIFDEIQQCPKAITSLKYFNEEIGNLAICAAGSLLGIFHGESSFPVGKVSFIEMYPLDFGEFLEAIQEPNLLSLYSGFSIANPTQLPESAHSRLWELWKIYMITGGMPAVVDAYVQIGKLDIETATTIRTLQKELVSAYTADIAKNAGRMKSLNIERLWKNVPQQLAHTNSENAAKFKFKDALPGLREYEKLAGPLDWLEKAGLVQRSSIIEKPEIPLSTYKSETRFKLYLFDTGLLSAMSEITPVDLLKMDFGSFKGYLAENFVAQQLKASGIAEHYCWEGRQSEVEFLLYGNSGIIPVEVKSGSNTRSKSLKVYRDKFHPLQSIILSGKNVPNSDLTEPVHLPLYLAGKLSALV
jgi:predicted AAA+ superfamily ATPase